MKFFYFNSGLHRQFYTTHTISYSSYKYIKYNIELLAEHFKNDRGLEFKDEVDKHQQVQEMVYDALSSTNVYFAPLIFNEEIALSCGLIPFIYHGKKLLALGGYGIDLIPRLEAYQLLVHNTIDRESKFFVIGDASYFASALISKNVIQEVLEKITKSYNNIAI